MREGELLKTGSKAKGRIRVKKTNLYSSKLKVKLINKKGRCMGLSKKESLTCINDIKSLIQQSMKEKGITSKQARKSLGIKRYEKEN